jgi:cephalosporin-C deacetylase-like acetyl esterase
MTRRNLFWAVVLVCSLAVTLRAQSPESLDFLTDLPDFEHVREMLPSHLNGLAIALLEERKHTVSQIATPADLARRKVYVRERILNALGGFPERTPLNARVVGTLDRDGYRVEKVIFESQPKFYVTGNLYLPKSGQAPYPAVLFPLGHERGGKPNPDWQHVLVSLARRGFVAFTWDTLGQGERSQFWDTDLETSKLGETGYTSEHTMIGAQCLLAGDNIARYTIWDGIRALDYLLSRPEVDPTRVACTGNSGGGTHTAYISALDDRITVAAPSCFITSWRRLLESIGPQDAEQCLPPFLKDGLDHGDFIYAFAPKPYIMLTAIRDFFSISGARETFTETSRVYSALGSPDKLRKFEADNTHGYSMPRRLAAYDWLSRWLKGNEDHTPEQEVKIESARELQCTPTGQVASSLGGETVFSLNIKRIEQNKPRRAPLTSTQAVAANRIDLRREVRRVIGFDPRSDGLNVKPFGRIEADGFAIEKLIYESEPGIVIPAALLIPKTAEIKKPAVVYVNDKGKSAGWGFEGAIQQLVKRGFVVLAIDVRGCGETHPQQNPDEANETYRYFGGYDSAMRAFLVGKTLVGMRAEDIFRGVDLLTTRPEVDPARIYGFGVGAGALTLLHEAALDDRIKELTLDDMLVSYDSVVTHRIHTNIYESVVPGALKVYDLADLVAAFAPRPVWIVDTVDPLGKRVATGEVREQYARPIDAFKALGAEAGIHITGRQPEEGFPDVFREPR